MADGQVEALKLALERSGARSNCPMCDGTDWRAAPEQVHVSRAVQILDGMSALALTCVRCGFMRLHAAQALDQYMDPTRTD